MTQPNITIGPIIRINPNELHINDPDYYDTLYSREGKWEKSSYYVNSIGNTVAGFGTADHDLRVYTVNLLCHLLRDSSLV